MFCILTISTCCFLVTCCADAIGGYDQDLEDEIFTGPPKIVVAVESQGLKDVVIVGIK